jgi:hypothetical protein
MIRVQGLLHRKEEKREWAVQTDGVQTDGVLPRITAHQGKWRKAGKAVQTQGGRTLQDKSSPKNSNKQPWRGMEGGSPSCITTLPSPSSNKHTLANKENASSPTTPCSHLQAKVFKFLLFEEVLPFPFRNYCAAPSSNTSLADSSLVRNASNSDPMRTSAF